MQMKKYLNRYRGLAILVMFISIFWCLGMESKAGSSRTLEDAVLDEGSKSEMISLEGDFLLNVNMHTEVTDEKNHCIYLEMTLEEQLLIICFTNYDGDGQYRWWSDIKNPDGTVFIQKNCFKDLPVNMDISDKDIQVHLSRMGKNVMLQAYKNGEQGKELFCDYELEVDNIPENVNVYFGGENYKISNVSWNLQTDAETVMEKTVDEAVGIKASEAKTNNMLSDEVLNEGSKSETISLEGDFLLDVTMHTEVTDDKDHCLYLEMTKGEDILVVCFSHCERREYRCWADIVHPDGSRNILRDCFSYTGTKAYIEDKNLEVEFCRKGNKVTLLAKRTGLFRSKTFCDFELELENIPETVSIYFGGENVAVRDIQWNVGAVPERSFESLSLILQIVILLATVVLSALLYLFIVKVVQPSVENALRIYIPSFFDILSALCLTYAGMMVLSWYQWPLANTIINFINKICIISELSIPAVGMLLANRIFVIIVLLIGVGLLVYEGIDFGISSVFATWFVGMLKLITLYTPVSFCVQMLAMFVGALPSLLALLFLLFIFCSLGDSVPEDFDPLHRRKVEIMENGFHRNGEIVNIMGEEYLVDGSSMSKLTKDADGTWRDEQGNKYNRQ